MILALKILAMWTMVSFALGLVIGPMLRRGHVDEGATPDPEVRPDQWSVAHE